MPPSSSRLARGVFLAAAIALYANVAAAAPEPTTDALVERGLELRRARRDEAALETFEQAYRREKKPMILAQIALAEQALGRFPEAEQHLTQSLASPDTWVEQHRPPLEKALSVVAARLGWLEITVSSPGAELRVDAQPRSLSASPFRLTAGPHTVEVRSASGNTIARSLELSAGERQVFHLEIPDLAATPAPPPVAAVPKPAPQPLAPPRQPAPLRAPPKDDVRPWAYASATLAGVALLEAIAASVIRQSYVDDYNGADCAPARSQRCPAERRAANTFGAVAVVGYAVAGAAGLTSFALFAKPWWSPNASQASAVVGVSGAF